MAADHLIAPFPADVDRDAFGHYLAGLTDGEGCFFLAMNPDRRTRAYSSILQFVIQLRADDLPILQLVQSYLQVGRVGETQRKKIQGNRKPKFYFNVSGCLDLATVIVPHFDRYPLRAKKRRDFAIWRQAVLLAATVRRRRHYNMRRGRHGGFVSKWSPDERRTFMAYCDALRAQREYLAPVVEPSLPAPTVRGLFDGLQ